MRPEGAIKVHFVLFFENSSHIISLHLKTSVWLFIRSRIFCVVVIGMTE